MKKLIICLIIILSMNFIVAQTDYNTYYKIGLDYDKGNINISSLEIEFSQDEIENFFGIYSAIIFNYNDEILSIDFFEIPNKILWDGIDEETGEINQGGEMELDQVSFEIFIPYYENAKEIIIYNENLTEITIEDVSKYSKQVPKEEIKDEKEIEKEKKTYEEKTISEKLVKYWWIFLITLIILIIVFIYSLKKENPHN